MKIQKEKLAYLIGKEISPTKWNISFVFEESVYDDFIFHKELSPFSFRCFSSDDVVMQTEFMIEENASLLAVEFGELRKVLGQLGVLKKEEVI